MSVSLPVDAIRRELLEALAQRPVVLTAPTGTGKSTQVPRWIAGRVLMIQPRRVAARAVAARIAELDGVTLGSEVGYRVRDEDRSQTSTRILVVTPGIVLGRPALLEEFDAVILDEFHERRLDTDMIVGLLLALPEGTRPAFIVMSATLDAKRLAVHLSGQHLSVEARHFPVEVSYAETADALPTVRDLERRVLQAITRLNEEPGDILVFLPGKSEISSVERALLGTSRQVVVLHGGLNLEQQAAVLRSEGPPRILLSTNVAETSVTIPGVRVVIDSGLVRRTTYHEGRSYLELRPIAEDSAAQRAGRAGRTAPGKALRLWGGRAQLLQETPPEIYRESLVPLVMTAAAQRLRPEALRLVDPPKKYALRDARDRLVELGLLRSSISATTAPDELTEHGRRLYGLPLDPWLSRILVEAEVQGCLDLALPLVAALEQPLATKLARLAPDEVLEVAGCDALALLWVMREQPAASGAEGQALREAQRTLFRLCRAMGLTRNVSVPVVNLARRKQLLCTLMRADRRMAHVARRRKGRLSFSNGGTEKELSKDSRLFTLEAQRTPTEAGVMTAVVLSSRAVSSGTDRTVFATIVAPVDARWFAELGLGEERVSEARPEKKGPLKGKLVVERERIYCGSIIEQGQVVPQGALAREAIARLFLSKRLFPKSYAEACARLSRRGLAAQLGQKREGFFEGCVSPPSLSEWLTIRLEELGVESGEDLALLSADDFLPDDVTAALLPQLKERFPQQVDVGDAVYAVEYDLEKGQVLLNLVRGHRTKPPQSQYLPRFEGFRVFVEAGGSFHAVRR